MDPKLRQLLRLIETDTCRIGPDGETVDAYAAELLMHWHQVRAAADSDPACRNPEGYAWVAAANLARSVRRRRYGRKLRVRMAAQVPAEDAGLVAPSAWDGMEARDLVRVLRESLSVEDVGLLWAIAEAGSVRAAYAPERGCSMRTWHTRCRSVQQRAAALLRSCGA